MKTVLALVLAALPLLSVPAAAATEQQNKMTACNQQAAGKKGEERKAFMKSCLSAKPAASAADAGNAQQNRMKVCNQQAAGKKGDERKAFMKTCLKG